MKTAVVTSLAIVVVAATIIHAASPADHKYASPGEAEVEKAILAAQAAPQEEESYQRVYEAFTKLLGNVSNNSLSNARRLVSRLNQLVGGNGNKPSTEEPAPSQQQQVAKREQTNEEKTQQILDRLDKVNKDTDQNTLRQLNDDVNRLVTTLNDSYLRNLRRVIERVNKVVGQPSVSVPPEPLHQSGDRLDGDNPVRQPGFPGWDELIVAVDRMQKSLANFVRSSTKLITAG